MGVLEDVHEIEKLKARYADAVDGGWTGTKAHDPDAVVALFVPDGVWDSGDYGGGEGHDGIRAFMATGEAIMPFAFHHITNPRIEVDGDRATARWHALLAVTLEGRAELQTGIYDDVCVRTPDGWRFERLQFTLAGSTSLPETWKTF
ncbi:MAG: nuclear transport factor 2 family protein [bacterium]|nr:nuclear transport factor 2 family protein [bacterium]